MAAAEALRLGPTVIDDADLAALADRLADQLAQRLVPTIAELLRGRVMPAPATAYGPASSRGNETNSFKDATNSDDTELWGTRRVAAHYGVGVTFVYEHADELGCIRLGTGPRARLRFDPRIVRERLPRVGRLPEAAPTRRRSPRRTGAQQRPGRRSSELLKYDREP